MAHSVKANKLAIDSLRPASDKYEVCVLGYAGLVVRVWPSGARTFVYRHRQDGRLRRIALKATTLAAAIAEWAQERQDARQGVDVSSRRSEARQATKLRRVESRRHPTMSELVNRYLDEYAKRYKRSWQADERLLRRLVLPDLGQVKTEAVRRADIHALVHRIARKTPTQANRVLAVTRKLFSFALDAGVIETHPCLRMKAPSPENQRDRVLTDNELKSLWNAPPTVMRETVLDAVRLQLLTACRISEVIGANTSEVNLEAMLWTIPGVRTKNGLDHVVPISAEAEVIFRDRCDNNGFLFPWPTSTGCLMADTMSHQIIDALPLLQIDHFTTHDLRRTVATRLSELGFNRETRERVLNHKDRTTMGKHYDKYDGLREKREALVAWSNHLHAIVTHANSTPAARSQKLPRTRLAA